MRTWRRVVTTGVAATLAVAVSACGGGDDGLLDALAGLPADEGVLPFVSFSRPAAGLEALGVEGDGADGEDRPGPAFELARQGLLATDHSYTRVLNRYGPRVVDLAVQRGFDVDEVEMLVSSAQPVVDVVVGPDPDDVATAARDAGAVEEEQDGVTRLVVEDAEVRETIVVGDGRLWITGVGDDGPWPPREGRTFADQPGVADVADAIASHGLLAGTILLEGLPEDVVWEAAAFGRGAADDVVWVIAVHDDAASAATTESRFGELDTVRASFGRDAEIGEVRRDGTTVVLDVRTDASRHLVPLTLRAIDVLLPGD